MTSVEQSESLGIPVLRLALPIYNQSRYWGDVQVMQLLNRMARKLQEPAYQRIVYVVSFGWDRVPVSPNRQAWWREFCQRTNVGDLVALPSTPIATVPPAPPVAPWVHEFDGRISELRRREDALIALFERTA